MSLQKYLFIMAGILAMAIGGMIVQAWAVVTLWDWFLVPNGIRSINMVTAIGISLIFSLFHHHSNISKNDSSKPREVEVILGELAGHMFLTPTVAVGIGWCVTLFI